MARRRRRESATPEIVTAADLPDAVLLLDLAAWRDVAAVEAPDRVDWMTGPRAVEIVAAGMHARWRRDWLAEYAPHLTRREVADEAQRRRGRLS